MHRQAFLSNAFFLPYQGDNSGCWQVCVVVCVDYGVLMVLSHTFVLKELLAIKHDCDGDALMFTVIQHGIFYIIFCIHSSELTK